MKTNTTSEKFRAIANQVKTSMAYHKFFEECTSMCYDSTYNLALGLEALGWVCTNHTDEELIDGGDMIKFFLSNAKYPNIKVQFSIVRDFTNHPQYKTGMSLKDLAKCNIHGKVAAYKVWNVLTIKCVNNSLNIDAFTEYLRVVNDIILSCHIDGTAQFVKNKAVLKTWEVSDYLYADYSNVVC